MTFIPSWEEFEKSAEMLYMRDPLNTRYSMKYSHSKGAFLVKITDNKKGKIYKALEGSSLHKSNEIVIHNYDQPYHFDADKVGCSHSLLRVLCLQMALPNFTLVTILPQTPQEYSILFVKCLQYKTEVQQDVRKIDKFISDLMRHMASNDK